ncbi:hypothetical protein GCM10010174_30090 [Kutzneria viridogrisea]
MTVRWLRSAIHASTSRPTPRTDRKTSAGAVNRSTWRQVAVSDTGRVAPTTGGRVISVADTPRG